MSPVHPLMQFFTYAHLPAALQAVSKPFAELARRMDDELPGSSQKDAMLQRLLEAKDCAVRALLYKGA